MHIRLPDISLAALFATLAFASTASADSRTFSNPFPVSPADAAGGQPGIQSGNYPSQVRVGGMAGTITGVQVKLRLVSGTFPADLEAARTSCASSRASWQRARTS